MSRRTTPTGREISSDAKRLVPWLALVVVVILAVAVGGTVSFFVSGDSRDDRLEQNIRDVRDARKDSVAAFGENQVVSCIRNNQQDAVLDALLVGAVKAREAEAIAGTRIPMTAQERALLDDLRKALKPRDCANQPAVKTAIREKSLTRDDVTRIIKRESRSAADTRG